MRNGRGYVGCAGWKVCQHCAPCIKVLGADALGLLMQRHAREVLLSPSRPSVLWKAARTACPPSSAPARRRLADSLNSTRTFGLSPCWTLICSGDTTASCSRVRGCSGSVIDRMRSVLGGERGSIGEVVMYKSDYHIQPAEGHERETESGRPAPGRGRTVDLVRIDGFIWALCPLRPPCSGVRTVVARPAALVVCVVVPLSFGKGQLELVLVQEGAQSAAAPLPCPSVCCCLVHRRVGVVWIGRH